MWLFGLWTSQQGDPEKLSTKEHNFDKALKKALSQEAAKKDVAAFSQEDATLANLILRVIILIARTVQ